MLKKRTRRVVVIVILVTLFSALEPVHKLLVIGPSLAALLMDWDEFYIRKIYNKYE